MTETQSTSTSSDKLWIVLCHLSPILGLGLVGPLVVYLVTKNDRGSTIPPHAKETLNFHISLAIYGIISAILIVILVGALMLAVLGIATIVLSVVGAVKASDGIVYRYPATIRLVK